MEDDFGGRLAGDGPVEFVLDGGEEVAGLLGVFVVVGGEGVDVGDFLVEAPLAGADFADLFEEVPEVVVPEAGPCLRRSLSST